MPYLRATTAVLCAAAVAVLLGLLGGRATPARAASVGQLQSRIQAGQSAISGLAGALHQAQQRVGSLDSSISALEERIARIQADLDAKRAQLVALRTELAQARDRLAQLQARDQRDSQILSAQLLSRYESDSPDLVNVVLDSTGFQDLLERISFQQRISRENAAVITTVRSARKAEALEAIKLGALEVRQQKLTEAVLLERNSLVQTRVGLVQEELQAVHVRDSRAGALASAQAHVGALRQQLAQLQAQLAAQAAAAARAAAAAAARNTPSAAAVSSAPAGSSVDPSQVSSAGGFTFPLPKGSVVGPGSWSPDDGIDMSAPGNTPEFAVCSGTIVLHGIGGFGPWAPVLHCDSPLDGYSYVYYGHAGPANQLPVGTHVSSGEVMSSVGPGIVGISTGPHIEIGFCDGSGTPIGPSSAGAMMALLQSSY